MRKMNVLVAVIGVIALFAAGSTWLALGGWKQIGTRFEDDASSAAAISEIRVIGRSVEVDVRPGTGAGVEIHRTARYLNPFHAQPGPTHQIEGNVLTLRGDDACTFCVIEYSVTVPAGVRVSADMTSGSLNLKGVSTVDATRRRARSRSPTRRAPSAHGQTRARSPEPVWARARSSPRPRPAPSPSSSRRPLMSRPRPHRVRSV